MPQLSQAEMLRYARRRLLSTERFVDALLVVEDHAGVELFRVGGRWDTTLHRYVAGDVKPRVIRLKESQTEAGRGFALWLESARKGVEDPLRAIVLMLFGARGSGKTWLLGLLIVAIGLEWPRELQFSVNLSIDQRREVIESIEEVCGPKWVADQSEDQRSPWLLFVTRARVKFVSARNPKRLRQAKLRIRAVHLNEAQDQDEAVYVNAVMATRNVDGLLTIATNRPQDVAYDWVTLAADGIIAGEIAGLAYLLDPRKNDAVAKSSLDKRAAAIRVVSPEAAAADTDPDAPMRLATKVAYPAFRALPVAKGGHIGEPPELGWTDVTLQITAAIIGGNTGFPIIAGIDFQREPGCIGALAKIYRDERGLLVVYVFDQIGVRGVEPDFSQALYAAGYRPTYGMDGTPLLLIGDGTGDRQNARHDFAKPTSFVAMEADGWRIIGPDRHWRTGIPWNPPVRLSRAQMHTVLEQHQLLLSPRCKDPCDGFPPLVDSFRRAPIGPKGGLVEKGHLQHGPDGVRYIVWRCLPRPRPPQPKPGIDTDSFNALLNTRLGFRR